MQHAKNSAAAQKKRRFGKARGPEMTEAQQRLVDEYFATLARLRSLEDFFEQITDHDLISSCVYEINAAQRQYAYLLSRLKEEEITYLKVLR